MRIHCQAQAQMGRSVWCRSDGGDVIGDLYGHSRIVYYYRQREMRIIFMVHRYDQRCDAGRVSEYVRQQFLCRRYAL